MRRAPKSRTLLAIPPLLFLTAFFVAPLAIMFIYSFYRFVPAYLPEPAFLLDNYLRVATDGYYIGILIRTLVMSLTVTVIALVLSFPLAYRIVRGRSRWSRALLPIVLMPLMTSIVARAYGWTALFNGSGVINSALEALGLPHVKLLFTLTGTMIALAEELIPFMVLSLVASLQHIDPTLDQAAAGLGATPLRAFRDIILPLSLPGVAAGSLFVFALSASAFAVPALVGGPSTVVMATEVYNQAVTAFDWPLAAALSFVLLVVTLGLTFVQGRVLRVSYSARKQHARVR